MSSKMRFLPILDWGKSYDRGDLTGDLLAAVIVTIMLIPQSLAYALLADLPPQMGLYASILPLVAYTFLGTSRTLSVGPVAVASLMTATAVGNIAEAGSAHYIEAAISLALLSGLFLLLLGVLRFGFLANFLSHPVVAGFITASGILIAFSQLKHIVGISAHGDTLPELVHTLWQGLPSTNLITLSIGMAGLVFLVFVRSKLAGVLRYLGVTASRAGMLCKTGPIIIVIFSTLIAWYFHLDEKGVAVIGDIPAGLPTLQFSGFEGVFSEELLKAAVLISIIGYVESISVGKTLGAKRRQRITPDQELVALGASNIASAVSGGFPVTGGFSRSVVNFDAGAVTPAAGFYTAIGIAIVTLFFTPSLAYLPKATLAATIIIAVITLVDFSIIKKTWRYSKRDFIAVMSTIIITLMYGVELGVL
ncbi:MAG: sodium-independent anion transporter, partial [Pseudomonadales bacterium]|nr:sodium-independent anion transporter [Pseudomonadales bacterium]